MINAVIEFGANTAADMSDAGKVDDPIDAGEERPPIDGLSKIVVLRYFYAVRKRQLRPANRGANDVAVLDQCVDHGPADKAGRTSHQNAAHALPRSKANSSHATSAALAINAAMLIVQPGTMTVSTESAPRHRFIANTRITTSMTVKTLSVAR